MNNEDIFIEQARENYQNCSHNGEVENCTVCRNCTAADSINLCSLPVSKMAANTDSNKDKIEVKCSSTSSLSLCIFVAFIVLVGSVNVILSKIKAKTFYRFNCLVVVINSWIYILVYLLCLFLVLIRSEISRKALSYVWPFLETREIATSGDVQLFSNVKSPSGNCISLSKSTVSSDYLSSASFSTNVRSLHSTYSTSARSHGLTVSMEPPNIVPEYLYNCHFLMPHVTYNTRPARLFVGSHVVIAKIFSIPNILSVGAWRLLALSGAMDLMSNTLSFIVQPYVSAPILLLCNQNIILFSVIVTYFAQNRRYTFQQLLAVMCVMLGFFIMWIPQYISHLEEDKTEYGGGYYYHIVAGFASLPTALSFVLKENVILGYRNLNTGNELNVFILVFHTCFFEFLLSPISLFISWMFGQMNGEPILEFLGEAIQCIGGENMDDNSYCEYAAAAYICYIIVNVIFNICLISFLRRNSTLLTFVCLKSILPVSILLMFLFRWPLLEQKDVKFNITTLLSLVIILASIAWFKFESDKNTRVFKGQEPPCCFPFLTNRNNSVVMEQSHR